MITVLIASSNAKKLKELQAIFSDEPGVSFELPPAPLEVEETGTTFAANARLKAEAYASAFDMPCLADDSGLVVEALDGRPGVYSARYAPTDAERIGKLLGELEGVPAEARTAAFVCAMALAWPDGRLLEVEGRCPGVITTALAARGGFGYDPVFEVPAHGKTFAELPAEVKNAESHRAIAGARLKAALRPLIGG